MLNLTLACGGSAECRLGLLPEEARPACGRRRARGAEPEAGLCRGSPECARLWLDGRRPEPGGGRRGAAEEPARLRGGGGETHGFCLQVESNIYSVRTGKNTL